jgi:hypothetical protein
VLRRLLIGEETLAHVSAPCAVAARRAVIMGCDVEIQEQLALMLDVMGWAVDAVDTAAALLDVLSTPRNDVDRETRHALPSDVRPDPQADLGPDLLFIDAGQIAKAGFAINRSRTVVFMGRAPAHGRALFAGKTIIWLDTPINIVKLERVIVNAA